MSALPGVIDLFKTGGGEALAREMNVRFLGRVSSTAVVQCGDAGSPYGLPCRRLPLKRWRIVERS